MKRTMMICGAVMTMGMVAASTGCSTKGRCAPCESTLPKNLETCEKRLARTRGTIAKKHVAIEKMARREGQLEGRAQVQGREIATTRSLVATTRALSAICQRKLKKTKQALKRSQATVWYYYRKAALRKACLALARKKQREKKSNSSPSSNTKATQHTN